MSVRLAAGQGVVDAMAQDRADDREGNEQKRPGDPVVRILRGFACGSELPGEERLQACPCVNGSVDDADGLCRVLHACEVAGGRSRKDSVHADHTGEDDEETAGEDP